MTAASTYLGKVSGGYVSGSACITTHSIQSQTAENNFPPIGNDPQTISLADMLVPGYPLNESKATTAVVN